MGLDMRLEKRTYVGNLRKEKKDQVKINIEDVKQERVQEVVEEVAYWRKANAIHRWFVENVQEGEDDCESHWVDSAKLCKLLNIAEEVLSDHSKAKELLPVQEGFFFGGYEYDEYYFQDLGETVDMLKPLLTEECNGYFYQSSW